MKEQNKIYQKPVRAISAIVLILLLAAACSEQNKETIKSFKDVRLVPTLRTTQVSTLISDSGITRYKLIAGEWLIFERVTEPYWKFPRGIYIEKFDSVFHVEASIKADTAYFFESRKLWRLRKNVKIKNFQGERFGTQELYWDQNLQKIYSDSLIKIEQTDRTIMGIGFESNEAMTHYIIHKPGGSQFRINDTGSQP